MPLPCFDYHRAALFVDDNQRHLTRILLKLDTHLVYSVFSDPQKVLHYLQTYGRPKRKFDIDTLYQEIQNPDRFNEPSLLITDYAMPNTKMNGFELCSEVKRLCKELEITPPKIILLSGQAGEDIAKEGLQKGYIDLYISKNDPGYNYKLNEAIQTLQLQFSQEQSATLSHELSKQPDFCLNDPHFIEFFKQLQQEHSIVEHFILNNRGDFLLSQYDGSLLWLKIVPEAEKENLNQMSESNAFKKLSGEKTNYYYVLRQAPDLAPVQRENILSLQHYLEHVWPIQ